MGMRMCLSSLGVQHGAKFEGMMLLRHVCTSSSSLLSARSSRVAFLAVAPPAGLPFKLRLVDDLVDLTDVVMVSAVWWAG